MKNTYIIIFISICAILVAVIYDIYAPPKLITVDDNNEKLETDITSFGDVPDFDISTIDGKNISIRDLRGKVVIINFWATWCSTCVIELPDMLNLVNNYEGKVILLAISSDSKIQSLTRFIDKQSDDLKNIINSDIAYISFDENKAITYDLFLTQRYPETIIVSKDGKMVRKIIGEFDWKSDDIKSYIDRLL